MTDLPDLHLCACHVTHQDIDGNPLEPSYEAGRKFVMDAWLIDDHSTAKLTSLVQGIVDAALGGHND